MSSGQKNDPGSHGLTEAWQDYFRKTVVENPAHPQARDFLERDLRETLGRIIPPDASVLDVGCGTGEILAALPNKERVGIAQLPEVAVEARRRFPDLTIEDGDLDSLERGRRFDAVICNRLCHRVAAVRDLLVKLRERVSNHGRLYLVTYNYLWEMPTRLAEVAGFKLPSPTSNWRVEPSANFTEYCPGMPDGFNDITRPGLAFGADHGSTFTNPAQSFA